MAYEKSARVKTIVATDAGCDHLTPNVKNTTERFGTVI